jgi:hypothetical protein
LKSAGRRTNNTKTVIVVALTRIIIVASGGAAIPRIVDPGAAPLKLPTPDLAYSASQYYAVQIIF